MTRSTLSGRTQTWTMVSGMPRPRSGLLAREWLATIVRMSEITQSINYDEAKPDSSKSSNNKHELILNVSDTKQTKTSDVYLEARCAANSQSGIRISRPGLHKLKAYSVCTRRSGVTSYKLCLVWKFGETFAINCGENPLNLSQIVSFAEERSFREY